MNVILLLCLGLPALGYAYQMTINHRPPWWKSSELSTNEVQKSYRYFYPYAKEHPRKDGQAWGGKELKKDRWSRPSLNSIRKKSGHRWSSYPSTSTGRKKVDFPWPNNKNYVIHKLTIPTIPPMSAERIRLMNAAQWPDTIPPLIMIKLPLDEPPRALP